MATCVDVYFMDDGSIQIGVEADCQPEDGEQLQPVESLDQVLPILQKVQQELAPQDQQQESPAEDAGEGFEAGFNGVRNGGINGMQG